MFVLSSKFLYTYMWCIVQHIGTASLSSTAQQKLASLAKKKLKLTCFKEQKILSLFSRTVKILLKVATKTAKQVTSKGQVNLASVIS